VPGEKNPQVSCGLFCRQLNVASPPLVVGSRISVQRKSGMKIPESRLEPFAANADWEFEVVFIYQRLELDSEWAETA
jgi:hypothetical protein